MTVIQALATHEVVHFAHPRPVTERDEIGMAVGKAIDGALARFSFEFRQSRRPTLTAMNRIGSSILDEELADADLTLSPGDREKLNAEVGGVLQAFRGSELFGLYRPRSRMILINERVGVYAQPDYWDGRSRFYEMKSYNALPLRPDVALQLQLFQLAFPGFQAFLACFDRHTQPVKSTLTELPALDQAASESILTLAYQAGQSTGQPKVLEYIDSPTVRYASLLDPGSGVSL
ncbi:MAG: hypothetical protein WB778_06510 [Thermoplasmata archaeon]